MAECESIVDFLLVCRILAEPSEGGLVEICRQLHGDCRMLTTYGSE
jgi:hypothetical protein